MGLLFLIKDIYIIIQYYSMIQKKNKVNEELTVSDVKSMIGNKLSKSDIESIVRRQIASMYSTSEFKKEVKKLAADVVSEVYKILWQRNNFWKSGAIN